MANTYLKQLIENGKYCYEAIDKTLPEGGLKALLGFDPKTQPFVFVNQCRREYTDHLKAKFFDEDFRTILSDKKLGKLLLSKENGLNIDFNGQPLYFYDPTRMGDIREYVHSFGVHDHLSFNAYMASLCQAMVLNVNSYDTDMVVYTMSLTPPKNDDLICKVLQVGTEVIAKSKATNSITEITEIMYTEFHDFAVYNDKLFTSKPILGWVLTEIYD